MSTGRRRAVLLFIAAALSLGVRQVRPASVGAQMAAMTPIRYLVVIDLESASFDHYFGNYPIAANPAGEPSFAGAGVTPSVNGLNAALTRSNPNAAEPFRIDRGQALMCAQSSRYDDEQLAYNGGSLDRFIENAHPQDSNPPMFCPQDAAGRSTAVMGSFDGNTVTALWNYAQQFAISDAYFGTTFGESTLGALHLVAADTSGAICGPATSVYGNQPACAAAATPPPDSTATLPAADGSTGTLVFRADPFWDRCTDADSSDRVALSGLTIGDLLDGAGVSWGWFQAGFAPSADGNCDNASVPSAFDGLAGIDPASDSNVNADFDASVEPFQFFASTANPSHLPPSDVSQIGHDDQANHQYDLTAFWQAADAGSLPSISFLKPAVSQSGRAGASNPLDQQQFLVDTVNRLEQLPQWPAMAIVVTWDDSGGWYDHVAPRQANQSVTPFDYQCGTTDGGDPGRCAYGPRLPLVAISPFARQNYISHTLIDQTSITRFIEDNWLGGQRLRSGSFDTIAGSLLDLFNFSQPPVSPITLDPDSGEPLAP